MPTIYVQFTDSSEQEIGGWFGMPQQQGDTRTVARPITRTHGGRRITTRSRNSPGLTCPRLLHRDVFRRLRRDSIVSASERHEQVVRHSPGFGDSGHSDFGPFVATREPGRPK